MKWYDKLKMKLKRFSIPNLMIYITTTMLFVYLVDMFGFITPSLSHWLYFSRSKIFSGQIWRIITFIFLPENSSNLFFFFFNIYLYVFIGRALEQQWGSVTFTRYYLLGMVGAILGGLLTGTAYNNYLNMSIFLAFAHFFPDMMFQLFFFIPVKAKWLGIAYWVIYGLSLIMEIVNRNIAGVVSLVLALVNFFIFFGPDIYRKYKHRYRHRELRKQFRDNDSYWR